MPSSYYKSVMLPPGEMTSDNPGPGIMMIERVRDTNEPVMAVFRCPCGCKELVKLPLALTLDRRRDAITKPRWFLVVDHDSNPTLDPFISGMCPNRGCYLIQCGRVTFTDTEGTIIDQSK